MVCLYMELFLSRAMLKTPKDSDRYPPPSRLHTAPNDAEEADARADTATTVTRARYQPSNKCKPDIKGFIRVSEGVSGVCLQGWLIPCGSRLSRQATAQSDDGSCHDGGHDGRDEGKRCNDGAADADNGVDQCLLLWFCHKYVKVESDECRLISADTLGLAVKLPFPLTPQFKSMLQSGVGTRDLDVRWVSSLSWYFLTLFGLQPVYNFILGSNNGKLRHP
jgi:hypothetical protein